MELKEIREETRKMLEVFVNTIGLDGEYYSQLNKTPILWGGPLINLPGEFLSPNSERLEDYMEEIKCDDRTKKVLEQRGIILINPSLKTKEAYDDLIVTIIHETIHANRDLLIFDSFRDGMNERAYIFNNNRFEQNTGDYSLKHADASQDILKGKIDNSTETINSYLDKTSEEIEDIDWEKSRVDTQLERQKTADEALVEIIAMLSYELYRLKEKNPNIWNEIEKMRDNFKNQDIGVMCEILLKHHDFKLFKWMLDPISYSHGDLHYDFFGEYTKNDQDLIEKLYNLGKINLEDLFFNMIKDKDEENER